jgi:hypothetical protein
LSIDVVVVGGRSGAITALARGDPKRMSRMTAKETTRGTYCLQDDDDDDVSTEAMVAVVATVHTVCVAAV